MTDIVNYKKISDLEEITEVTDGATVPVLDGDGVMKRISAAGIGNSNGSGSGGTAAPVIFKLSNNKIVHYDDTDICATPEEVVDAYFSGNAYIYTTRGIGTAPHKIIGFYISSAGIIAELPGNATSTIDCTSDDFTTAISKYLP